MAEQETILFLSDRFFPDVGGIEVNSEILALHFHNAGYRVRLLTWTQDKGKKSFPFHVIRNPSVVTLFKEHKRADIVYENNPSLRLSWPALFFKRTSVIALRTWIVRSNGTKSWQDILKFLWLRRAQAVIAISQAIRVKIWPNAIVIGNPYRNHLFRILPNSKREKHFVFLGRLVSDKGADLAIKALHVLVLAQQERKDNNLLFLTIIGEGPDRKELEHSVKKLSLEKNVLFTGTLQGNDLVACLNQHRMLLVPSKWEEPFGNVVLEGMACGCIPIVSDSGGLPDAVGNAGLLFRTGDYIHLATQMHSLDSNPEIEDTLRDLSFGHLTEHQPERIAAKYLEVIKNAVKE